MENNMNGSEAKAPTSAHDSDSTKAPQVFHGPFSTCGCNGCLEDAKKEFEKRFSDEAVTNSYVKKLEAKIEVLSSQDGVPIPIPFGPPPPRRWRSRSVSPSSSASSFNDVIPVRPRRERFLDSAESSEGSEDEGSADKKTKPNGPKLDIRRQKRIFKGYGEPKIVPDTDVASEEANIKKRNKQHVLTVFRDFDKSKNFWRKSIDIVSAPFVELLQRLSPYDIDVRLVDGVLRLTEPLMLLFHNRESLTNFVEDADPEEENHDQQQAVAHTKLILDYMRTEFKELSSKLDEVELADPASLIEFSDVWLVYRPGTIVYTKENGEYEAFVIDTVRGATKSQAGRSGRHSYSRLELTCWSIDYDGEIFGRVWTTHSLHPFIGSKEVASLDLVPETYLPEARAVKESLIARGRDFWSLQGQNYREYAGDDWAENKTGEVTRVMVDHMTYQRKMGWTIVIDKKKGPSGGAGKNWRDNKFNRVTRRRSFDHYPPPPPPRRRGNPVPLYDDDRDYSPERYQYNDDQFADGYERQDADRPPLRTQSKFGHYDVLKPDAKPDEFTLLLCSRVVQGFSFRERIWRSLAVTQLQPVVFRENSWGRLVLDSEYKDIVQAMVSSYVDKTATLDDLVAGKGKGLVGLLHGPPGSGKTLTAECVAESFKKPLYHISCGDIGTCPERLEESLEEIFDYAVTWDAILLLDEADIFLQDRDHTNLQRNALVSIFLRTLEYFQGILFLTTNRVGAFDQAFQSRIHVSLGLPHLDRQSRIEVWSIFLTDLASKQSLSAPQSSRLDTLVKESWSKEPLNGRQIRNAVRTALLIAEKKEEVVGERHFEMVLKIAREFGEYMCALKGEEEDVVAEQRGERLADRSGFLKVEKP